MSVEQGCWHSLPQPFVFCTFLFLAHLNVCLINLASSSLGGGSKGRVAGMAFHHIVTGGHNWVLVGGE